MHKATRSSVCSLQIGSILGVEKTAVTKGSPCSPGAPPWGGGAEGTINSYIPSVFYGNLCLRAGV